MVAWTVLQSHAECHPRLTGRETYLDEVEHEPGGNTLPHDVDEEVGEGHAPDVRVLEHIVEEKRHEGLLLVRTASALQQHRQAACC